MPRISREMLQRLRGNGLGRIGDYGSDDPNVGQGVTDYREDEVWGNVPQGGDPAALYDVSAQSLGVIQDSPGDAPGFDAIIWSTLTYVGNKTVKLPADKNRVVLIVENISTTTVDIPIAVSFGINASTAGAGPNGLQLQRSGSVLYIDTYCPTNDVYLFLPAAGAGQFAAASIVLGTRGQPKSALAMAQALQSGSVGAA
jgi:hypothetical protein